MAKGSKTGRKRTNKSDKTPRKIINWAEYNQALVNRGNFTFWISDDVLAQWRHENNNFKVGRPFTYSDLAIETLLTLRELFRLTYRGTEGFAKGIIALMQIELLLPDFTTLAKRAKTISISLAASKVKGAVALLVDSTGLKVYGEGEWKVRKYGWSKRRTWRKLHLAVNAETQEIEAEILTDNSTDDAAVVDDLLDQTENQVGKFSGDGAYDKCRVSRVGYRPPLMFYDTLLERDGIVPIIPPRCDAKIKQHGNSKLPPLARDVAIRGIRKLGRSEWKRQVGYHRRSLAETAMFRMKTIFGASLKNRSDETQKTEVTVRCKILNHFTRLGMPKYTEK
jgi:hypothetical protein